MRAFKFTPLLKSMIWGGNRIASYKGIAVDRSDIGESWELSGVKGDESVVAEGEYAGMTLPELIGQLKGELVGHAVYERHGKNGKTEMWYVVAADRGAHLKSGFSEQLTPAEYERKVADHTLTDALCDYSVAAGDLFFLPAGRVHAICAGTFVAEIQQTSDVTYRIYDYGRTGADGKPRELHTELAKDAIDYTVLPDYRSHYVAAKNREVPLVSCPYFVTSLYDLDRAFVRDLSELDSFLIVMCLEGSGALCDDEGNEMPIRQGETLLVPASARLLRLLPDEHLKLLTGHL